MLPLPGAPNLLSETGLASQSFPALGVMGAARLLGIATSTLRSWDRRYGLTPSLHTKGGHRRYSPLDIARLQAMGRLVRSGVPPAEAAHACRALSERALALPEPTVPPQASTPAILAGNAGSAPAAIPEPGTGQAENRFQVAHAGGGRVLPLPGAAPSARGLARAASALDTRAARDALHASLASVGVVATWEDLARPVLCGVGARWAATGTGVEIEHAFSGVVASAFSAYALAHAAPSSVGDQVVVLASVPDELHDLPLVVLHAALAERAMPSVMLGARTPEAALADAVLRLRPAAVVLWAQSESLAQVPELPGMRPAPALVLAGPGWAGQGDQEPVLSLTAALDRLAELLGR